VEPLVYSRRGEDFRGQNLPANVLVAVPARQISPQILGEPACILVVGFNGGEVR
jgi:hypothetical protein